MSIVDEDNKPRPAIATDPLPLPGESLRREIDRLTEDVLGPWAGVLAGAFVFCFLEWYRYFFNVPVTWKSAIGVTIGCVIAAAVALRKLFKVRRQFSALYKGARGEHHVGRYLDDECSRLGYRVHHDIPGDDFNVDHALIGPGGVFSIETKTWTKPPKGTKAVLRYDGARLVRPDGSFDTAALDEARACADHLRKVLAKHTGRDAKAIPVRPILLFPGWYIEGKSFGREVWVFGDETLHRVLGKEFKRLSSEEIALLHQSLAAHTRKAKK